MQKATIMSRFVQVCAPNIRGSCAHHEAGGASAEQLRARTLLQSCWYTKTSGDVGDHYCSRAGILHGTLGAFLRLRSLNYMNLGSHRVHVIYIFS